MIEIKDLAKIYNTEHGEFKAIENINLTIEDGDIFGIIGMSGAGKSTLLRCINLLERPTLGQILIDGQDVTSLDGKALLEESLAVMDGIRDANIKETAEKFGADAAHGKASDDFDAIGMALAERRVGALFLVKGKILPGGFDINTGTVTFDGDPNPVDDGYIDPAAPDITDAFAQAALAQDAHIYIVEQDQMPTDQPVAALFRYAE